MPKHLTFDGKFWDLLVSGKKRRTLRRHRPKVEPGDEVYVHCGGYVLGKAKIKDVRPVSLKELTDELAKEEGFSSKEELLRVLKEIYPDLSEDETLWLIDFEFTEKFKEPIFSESFTYSGIHPLEIAKKALSDPEIKLSETDRILLELFVKTGSIRKAAEMLGSLSKRRLIRRALRRAYDQLLEQGKLQPKIKVE
ncbi:MAG: ASCH domain-containing protein [bacterium]|nr:ASCH domain-containing protein [bacterium]